jgi:hypothetical protein
VQPVVSGVRAQRTGAAHQDDDAAVLDESASHSEELLLTRGIVSAWKRSSATTKNGGVLSLTFVADRRLKTELCLCSGILSPIPRKQPGALKGGNQLCICSCGLGIEIL